MDRYLIFDLGGTSVKYAVSDKDGAFDTAGAFATPREGMERMLEEMERVYEAVQTGPGVTEAAPSGGDSCGTRIVGAAISSPGAVDIRTGMVGGISAIPYIHGIPLAEAVSRRLNGIPVTMEMTEIARLSVNCGRGRQPAGGIWFPWCAEPESEARSL